MRRNNMKTLKGLKLNTDRTCTKFEIPDGPNTLDVLQEQVGGYIEIPHIVKAFNDLDIDMIINDEGKLLGLEPTLAILQGHKVADIIHGPILFVSHDDEGNTVSLNKQQEAYLMETVFKAHVVGIQLGDELHIMKFVNL